MSYREETRQKEEEREETSNSFWNFGNARGPKSLCCSGRRKDVSVLRSKAPPNRRPSYGKFKVGRLARLISCIVLAAPEHPFHGKPCHFLTLNFFPSYIALRNSDKVFAWSRRSFQLQVLNKFQDHGNNF